MSFGRHFIRKAFSGATPGARSRIYGVSFMYNTLVAFLTYYFSLLLSHYVPDSHIGLYYALAYGMALLFILHYPRLFKWLGLKYTLVLSVLATIVGIIGMASNASIVVVLAGFTIYIIAYYLASISIDILLELYSTNSWTGRIRGFYLSLVSIAWVLAPLGAGMIIKRYGFGVFLWSAVALGALLLLLSLIFVKRRVFYEKITSLLFKDYLTTLRDIIHHPHLFKISAISFLLETFFSVMVIYTPLYLVKVIGISYDQLGILISIMICAYVLIEFPAGIIADKFYGEKEMLAIGFIIIALSTFAHAWVGGASIILWGLVMFASRCGAAIVEVMRDTYFFKHVDASEVEMIQFFRLTGVVGNIIGPLAASVIIAFYPFPLIYIVLSAVMLSGIYFSLTLRDTR